jgi:hypothetical protein
MVDRVKTTGERTKQLEQIEELYEELYAAEDKIFALSAFINVLIAALRDAGIPLKGLMNRHWSQAANDLEFEEKLPGAAAYLDELFRVADALVHEPPIPQENNETDS